MDANNPRLHWEHDGDLPAVAAHLRQCAESWEPQARLFLDCYHRPRYVYVAPDRKF